MANYCFYIGEDLSTVDRLRRSATFCWGAVEEFLIDQCHLFVARDDHGAAFARSDTLAGVISGYARRNGDQQGASTLAAFFHEIAHKNWPLGDEWTGSFSSVVYSSPRRDVTLCNDVLGHLPLYYSFREGGLFGGTSLIVLGRTLGCEPDPVGVLQRVTVPFCNYGRRTLLKSVERLLPGERLRWNPGTGRISREFDNTLCASVSGESLGVSARRIFDRLKAEIDAALGNEKEVVVATSGGWDSRLILGGLPADGYSIRCLTYGGPDLYETGVARRCAEAVGATHRCFSIEGKYFPSRQQIESLVRQTESANYFEWFGIIEEARSSARKPLLLLGDLCESIDGRYMTTYSSRKARVRSYLGGIIGKHEIFDESTDAAFRSWCRGKSAEIEAQLLSSRRHLSPELEGALSEAQFADEIRQDLALSFARVSAHEPRFTAMYDELFIWLHRIRYLLGNQISWLGAAFRPVSPGLAVGFLRLVTTVHPQHRIRKRLMNAIIDLPEFDRLARIPSSQVPFLSSRSPSVIRDAVWGLRSGLDQFLMKGVLARKRFAGRQRVLPSLDYIKEYRRPETAENVSGWFSDSYVSGDEYLRMLRERAELEAWPLINVDIAAPANVGIILDLCRPGKEPVTSIGTGHPMAVSA